MQREQLQEYWRKPISRRIRGRPRKGWIEDVEEDIQRMGGDGGESNLRKRGNGRESL
jgi:hypothetical protein